MKKIKNYGYIVIISDLKTGKDLMSFEIDSKKKKSDLSAAEKAKLKELRQKTQTKTRLEKHFFEFEE